MSKRRRRNKLPADPVEATITNLSVEGRGITQIEGKTVFIDGALKDETVLFKYSSRRSKFDEGYVEEVLTPSPLRVEGKCEHYGMCGGCSLQHMSHDAQLQHKQDVLIEQLQHIGNVQPESILPPLTGPEWGYRHKARLGVKHVPKKGKVLVGFREKRSAFIADLNQCEVLNEKVGYKLQALQDMIERLSVKDKLPQIEVAIGDDNVALVFRHLEALTEDDETVLIDFSKEHNMQVYLQSGGPDTVIPLNENIEQLSYALVTHDVVMNFKPTDFTQINVDINRSMIDRVMEFMQFDGTENVLDLFCGLGNFTLPMARYAKQVTGVEVLDDLVQRAGENAKFNKLDNAKFIKADLFKVDEHCEFIKQQYDKILLDPARTGAKEVISALDVSQTKIIVYVSCNPATLARDAGILVNEKGLKLKQAGIMDMFPHTSHVESIAVFTH